MRNKFLLSYLVLCLIWGSTWLIIRVIVRDIPPLEAAGVRFLIGGAVLILLALVQRRTWPRDASAWKALCILSVTIMAVPYGLLFWAEQYVTSSIAAITYSASPLIIALLMPLMSHRRVPRQAVFALVVAFGALLVILYTGLSNSRSLWAGATILLGVALSSWSIVFAKTRLQDVDPMVSTGVQLSLGSLVLMAGSLVLERDRTAHWSASAIASLVFLALLGSSAAFVIYYALLKKMQPYQLATNNLVVPLIAVLEGSFFGREPVPPLMLVAMAILLISVGSVLLAEATTERVNDLLMLREDRS